MKKKEIDIIDSSDKADEIIKDKTFVVKIKYNQNHSIQGSIQWVEQKKTVHFRSMMELILLLGESVESKDIRSWNGTDGIMTLVESASK